MTIAIPLGVTCGGIVGLSLVSIITGEPINLPNLIFYALGGFSVYFMRTTQ